MLPPNMSMTAFRKSMRASSLSLSSASVRDTQLVLLALATLRLQSAPAFVALTAAPFRPSPARFSANCTKPRNALL